MAESTATHSYGTLISIDPAGGTSNTAVAEVIEINGPGIKIGSKSRTHLKSDSAAMEKIPGLIDMGQVTLKLNFTKAQYALFLSSMVRVKDMSIKITWPLVGAETVPSSILGKGFLTELGQAIPDDDTITNDVTLEASGLWVFTSGT